MPENSVSEDVGEQVEQLAKVPIEEQAEDLPEESTEGPGASCSAIRRTS